MNIFKKISVSIIAVLMTTMLMGCEKETKDYTKSYALPEGMQDCKIYEMRGTNSDKITVVRCPSSSTTTSYNSGKNKLSSTVVEVPTQPMIRQGKNIDEIEINGEAYRRSESMKEIQVNGESYKKLQ